MKGRIQQQRPRRGGTSHFEFFGELLIDGGWIRCTKNYRKKCHAEAALQKKMNQRRQADATNSRGTDMARRTRSILGRSRYRSGH